MISLLDVASLPDPIILPHREAGPRCPRCGREAGHGRSGCRQCGGGEEAYRPEPQITGNLQVDPEVALPSPGMEVRISYFYNSASTYNGPYGYGRSISLNGQAQASGTPLVVTVTHGDASQVVYSGDATGLVFTSQTPGNLNTALQRDNVNNLWKEVSPDGYTSAYPLNITGMVTSLAWVQDPVGNTHSLTYSSGLLQSLQEGGGRLVTFSWNASNLLSSIECQ